MKKNILINLLIFITFSIVMNSCEKENLSSDKSKGELEFSISISQDEVLKSLDLTTTENKVHSATISIIDQDNNSIFNKKNIKLLHLNGNYISEPISLKTGNYHLTEFFLLDDSNNILYAAPIEGSPKSHLVNNPLPIAFSINKDEVTKLVPEVLDAQNSTPEDFGYATFSFEIIKNLDFLLSVFIYDYEQNNFKLTDAYLTILNDSTVIYSDSLENITNSITVNNNYHNYEIIIEKNGYKPYHSVFPRDTLRKYNENELGPLMVILEEHTQESRIIYGITWDEKHNRNKIATIDYANGTIEYSPALNGFESISAGTTAFDPVNKKFIVVSLEHKPYETKRYINIIDPQTGVIDKSIETEYNPRALVFDSINNKIYGLVNINNKNKIATIDHINESIELSPEINGFDSFMLGTHTFDPSNNRYIVLRTVHQNDYNHKRYISIIDPQTGIIERTIEFEHHLSELEFDKVNNKLYGLSSQNNGTKFVTIDYTNGNIKYSPKIDGLTSISGGSSTFDPVNNKYIVVRNVYESYNHKKYVTVINPQTGVIEKSIECDSYLGGLVYGM